MNTVADRSSTRPRIGRIGAHRPVSRGSLGPAYVLSVAAAVLLAASSVAGVIFGSRGLYDPDPATLPAFQAQDYVSLVLAVPLLVGAMGRARRGSVRGVLLWAAVLLYVVYSYFFFLVGVRFNPLFLVYVALVSTSLYGLVALLARTDADAVREELRGSPRRAVGGFLLVVALLFAGLWVADVVRRLAGGVPLDAVARNVYVADLTVMLPATALAGAWLWRARPWGYVLAGLLLVKMTALGMTLLAGAALQAYWGARVDPLVPFYGVLAGGGLAGTLLHFRGWRPAERRGAPSRSGLHREAGGRT